MNEREIERLAQQLGAGAEVDPDRMAESVLQRLREESAHDERAVGWWQQSAVFRLAAAVVFVVMVGLVIQQFAPEPGDEVQAYTTPAELEDLATDELVAVLHEFELRALDAATRRVGLDDLSEVELEQLLFSMEQQDGLDRGVRNGDA